MTDFDGRRGTRGSRQPKGQLMVWANAFMTTAAPRFGTYEVKTDREIPVIRLTRRAAP
jgi:hypothetical protein